MSELTTDQLQELTDRVNARIGEFGVSAPGMLSLTCGVVRLAFAVIEEWRREKDPAWVEQRLSAITISATKMKEVSDSGYKRGYEAALAAMVPAAAEAGTNQALEDTFRQEANSAGSLDKIADDGFRQEASTTSLGIEGD